jgi:hypothetical protein
MLISTKGEIEIKMKRLQFIEKYRLTKKINVKFQKNIIKYKKF